MSYYYKTLETSPCWIRLKRNDQKCQSYLRIQCYLRIHKIEIDMIYNKMCWLPPNFNLLESTLPHLWDMRKSLLIMKCPQKYRKLHKVTFKILKSEIRSVCIMCPKFHIKVDLNKLNNFSQEYIVPL